MPVYDYECGKCGTEFQIVESIAQHEEVDRPRPTCPKCKTADVKRVLVGTFVKTGKKS